MIGPPRADPLTVGSVGTVKPEPSAYLIDYFYEYWRIIQQLSKRAPSRVDPSTMQIDNHFGPESAAMPWTIIWWVFSPSCRRGDGFLPIRIRDLVESAQTGIWSVVYDDGMEPRAPRDAKDRNALF